MRTKIVSRLPTVWPKSPGLVEQANISVGHGRLRAKLLIFRTPRDLARHWKKSYGHSLGRGCLGVVNALNVTQVRIEKDGSETPRWNEVDARYFCVIGLCLRRLGMGVLTHECVHGGYAYARRRTRAPWNAHALRFDEEAVAYPAGELGRGIVIFLNRRKL